MPIRIALLISFALVSAIIVAIYFSNRVQTPELGSFLDNVQEPLRIVTFDLTGLNLSDGILQALTDGSPYSAFRNATEANNVIDADVAIFLLPSFDDPSDWPAYDFLANIFERVSNGGGEASTANIRIEIDGERQLGLIFVNFEVVPRATPECIAEFTNSVVASSFEDLDLGIWGCVIGR